VSHPGSKKKKVQAEPARGYRGENCKGIWGQGKRGWGLGIRETFGKAVSSKQRWRKGGE